MVKHIYTMDITTDMFEPVPWPNYFQNFYTSCYRKTRTPPFTQEHKELLTIIKHEFMEFGNIERHYTNSQVQYHADFIDDEHYTMFVLRYM